MVESGLLGTRETLYGRTTPPRSKHRSRKRLGGPRSRAFRRLEADLIRRITARATTKPALIFNPAAHAQASVRDALLAKDTFSDCIIDVAAREDFASDRSSPTSHWHDHRIRRR
jgi:3-dehydroquinate dehydratase